MCILALWFLIGNFITRRHASQGIVRYRTVFSKIRPPMVTNPQETCASKGLQFRAFENSRRFPPRSQIRTTRRTSLERIEQCIEPLNEGRRRDGTQTQRGTAARPDTEPHEACPKQKVLEPCTRKVPRPAACHFGTLRSRRATAGRRSAFPCPRRLIPGDGHGVKGGVTRRTFRDRRRRRP